MKPRLHPQRGLSHLKGCVASKAGTWILRNIRKAHKSDSNAPINVNQNQQEQLLKNKRQLAKANDNNSKSSKT